MGEILQALSISHIKILTKQSKLWAIVWIDGDVQRSKLHVCFGAEVLCSF